MKIGIISDTHRKIKKTKKAINYLLKNGAKFIIHAGDIVEIEILDMLEKSPVDYLAVYGNNDQHLVEHHEEYNLVQEPYYFNLAGLKFKLMHLPYYMAPDADVIIFGHTHHFECEMNNGKLYLNSGEVCARKKPISEFAMLEILEDKFFVTHYEKGEGEVGFSSSKYQYLREKKAINE